MPDKFFVGRLSYNAGTYFSSALSTSRISLDVNNSVNFNTSIVCSSCGVCYEYTIIIDSYYMGRTDEANAVPMCYCTADPNDNELLIKINLIASKKGAGPFLTFADGMSWVRSQGIFITNQNYPDISTLNHVLLLDAGLTASYPNQGIDWYNMALSSNNGTLNGGYVWSDTDKGHLNFNGTTGYVSFSSTSSIPIGNSNYTINVWFNPNSRTGTDGLIGWGGYGTNNAVNAIKLTSTGIQNVWGGNDLSVTTTINTGSWYNVVATFDGTTRNLYLNGSLIGTDTPVGHNVTTSSNLTIARTDSSEYFDGKISLVQILPSSLTASEILNSYNNFNTRYDGTFTEICNEPIYCSTPTPTTTTIVPTPSMTPRPTPPVLGQCFEVTNNQGETVYLDYKRVDGTQSCQPIGIGETLPVCVYPGMGGSINAWDNFPCSSPNTILPSAISVTGTGFDCYEAGDCINTPLNPIVLSYDSTNFNNEGGITYNGCSSVRVCVQANKP